MNTQLRDWTSDGPRRAGVMATGMGGTNAHVVLEEAPEPRETADARPPHLLILSAKTETALDQATHRLREFLNRNDSVNMSDVAYTLQVGRKAFPHRRFLVCSDREDAIAGLAENSKRLISSQVGRIAAAADLVVARRRRSLCRHGARSLRAFRRFQEGSRPMRADSRAAPWRRYPEDPLSG